MLSGLLGGFWTPEPYQTGMILWMLGFLTGLFVARIKEGR
jgi:hypothetical protein